MSWFFIFVIGLFFYNKVFVDRVCSIVEKGMVNGDNQVCQFSQKRFLGRRLECYVFIGLFLEVGSVGFEDVLNDVCLVYFKQFDDIFIQVLFNYYVQLVLV